MSLATDGVIQALDDERRRQGFTKKQLAEACGMLSTSVRRLFASKNPDVKLSTLNKIATALGADLQVNRVDSGLNDEQSGHLLARLRRVRLAERLAEKSGLDAGDIEHALFNLTLTTSERLARKLRRGRFVSDRR